MADYGVVFSEDKATFDVKINTQLSEIQFNESDARFEVSLDEENSSFDVAKDKAPAFDIGVGEVERVVVGAEPYQGEYVVTPKTEAQTLETKDKTLSENVQVLKIPFFSTSNNSGGNTVYIGSEV